jgi:hypothetical protein
MSHSFVSNLEVGVKVPSLTTLVRLAAAPECKVTELVRPFDAHDLATLIRSGNELLRRGNAMQAGQSALPASPRERIKRECSTDVLSALVKAVIVTKLRHKVGTFWR